jgi:hypothetical protein
MNDDLTPQQKAIFEAAVKILAGMYTVQGRVNRTTEWKDEAFQQAQALYMKASLLGKPTRRNL